MKKVVPFSNGSQAMSWMHYNCESCKTKCHFKGNIEMGFITGDITIKTAEHIGYTQNNKNYVTLNGECNFLHKYKKKRKKPPLKDQLTLF